MKRLFVFFTMFFMSLAVASQELWVIYHNGCPKCEAFLSEVLSDYPDKNMVSPSFYLPVKLLNTSLPVHQEQIARIKPAVFSTPTFLKVESSNGVLTVLDRWVGYSNKKDFYKKLNEAMPAV